MNSLVIKTIWKTVVWQGFLIHWKKNSKKSESYGGCLTSKGLGIIESKFGDLHCIFVYVSVFSSSRSWNSGTGLLRLTVLKLRRFHLAQGKPFTYFSKKNRRKGSLFTRKPGHQQGPVQRSRGECCAHTLPLARPRSPRRTAAKLLSRTGHLLSRLSVMGVRAWTHLRRPDPPPAAGFPRRG